MKLYSMSVSRGPNQLGHLHLLRHARLADALDDVVLGYLAAEWQRAAFRCNGLNLRPKCNLLIEKHVSGGTILSTFIGVMEMFHGFGWLSDLWDGSR
jgi:hypothetical protein